MRFFRLLLLFVLLTLVTAPYASAARLALVIGNDSYRVISALKNAKADAMAMAAELERSGFAVMMALDQDRNGINAAVRNFEATVSGGDEVVVFYAGHAVELGGINYLLPVDIRGDSDRQVQDDALPMQKISEGLTAQRPRFTLLIIDACRDNPFKGQGRNVATRGLAPATLTAGQMIVYSAGAGQRALDRLSDSDAAPNSVFTRVFLEEMAVPGVKVRDVVTSVRKRVFSLAKKVNHDQLPAVYDSALEDFVFRGGQAVAASKPTAVPPPASQPVPVKSDPVPAAPMPEPTPTPNGFRDCDDCPEMITLPAGVFQMGSAASRGRKEEMPIRSVQVGAVAMGRFEITQKQWVAFMGRNPSAASRCGDECPVERVSWDEVKMFIGKLNRKLVGREEGPYRLPTEAEWEYACRAGTDREFCGSDTADYAGWFTQNSQRRTQTVGGKQANAWGLHDMTGNVWEWTEDCWHGNFDGAPRDASAWVEYGCRGRVIRGGSASDAAVWVRAAARRNASPSARPGNVGFRVVKTVP